MQDLIDHSASLDNEHTLGFWLRDRARIDGSKIAVDDRGVTTDYLTLSKRVDALAEKFRSAGFVKGERIVTITGNSVDHIVTFFACAQVGLVLCPLSWRLTTQEVSDLIERTRPSLVVFEDEYSTLALEALRNSSSTAQATQIGPEGIESDLPLQSKSGISNTNVQVGVKDSDSLLLIFTSGSEAKPKGVLLSHSNCFWNNLSLAAASGLSPEDTALCALPQFHVGGWNIYPLLALWVGATLVLERTFQPKRIIELISKHKVSVMMGVPTQYQLLSQDDNFKEADFSTLRMAQVGGASIPAELLQVWQEKGVNLSPGYGLTEASPNVLYTPQGSKGLQPYPHVRVRLRPLNEETVSLENSKATFVSYGELQVSGPGVFSGYFEDEIATENSFTDDGWLKTGDIAELDTHGSMYIVGRIKEIYISGGENVAPAEIEHALNTHPAISETVVVGMPDRLWGEVGCAFVEIDNRRKKQFFAEMNKTDIEKELLTYTKSRLAPFKVPKKIIVLNVIPRIGIEKVDRVQLKAIAMKFWNSALNRGGETT
ncbi:MAG TPA: AMP-binding protein [Microbacteriaceae bacterium]|nr:AMP-binding protein [Microbacteriaceae bacterium]